jgi:hypothetical protein
MTAEAVLPGNYFIIIATFNVTGLEYLDYY